MIYYKYPGTGEVYAYESEKERHEWGAPELVKMTPAEVEAHLNPPVNPERLAAVTRGQRDTKLRATNWMVERHTEQLQQGDTTLTEAQYADLLSYRQALRDVPQQPGFPEAVEWPQPPEFCEPEPPGGTL